MPSKLKYRSGQILSFVGIVCTVFSVSGLEGEITVVSLGSVLVSLFIMAVGVLILNDEI